METLGAKFQPERGALFKSYYVVWKRLQETHRHVQIRVFKSYYVVWKPPTTQRSNLSHSRLNRTM